VPTTRTFVIALRDAEEVGVYLPVQFVAYAWSGNASWMPSIVISAEDNDTNAQTITHELTHAISFGVIETQPHWFAEGLASYFESAKIDEDHGTVELGNPSQNRLSWIRTVRPLPFAELMACQTAPCMDGHFYATAWAVFAFLRNVHTAELLTYVQALAAPRVDRRADPWRAVVPSLPPDTLDGELRKWLVYGQRQVVRYTVKFAPFTVRERVLTDGDALAARALLHQPYEREDAAIEASIRDALAADPTNVLGQLVAYRAHKTIALDAARAIAAAHPDDWRAWWLVLRAQPAADEARDALGRMCELAPANPSIACDQRP